MRKFYLKVLLMVLIVYIPVVTLNYIIDPAGLYNSKIRENAVAALNMGNIIESPGDMDEGEFQKEMISSTSHKIDTVILGSSHVMYIPLKDDNCYFAGVSGAYLGDYYGVIGLLDYYNIKPKKIIIGVDPWAFMSSYDKGRHTAMQNYAVYEHNLLLDDTKKEEKQEKTDFEKLEELFSFAYFQSSVKNLKHKGIVYYLNGSAQEVNIVNDDKPAEKAKILPNARRIMEAKGYKTVDENNLNAQKAIDANHIYQLGNGIKEINKNNFDDFEKLLVYMIDNNIEVELYLPSWYPKIYEYFEDTGSYVGVFELETMIRELGKKYNIKVRGSYDPSLCNVKEEDFADWLHLKPEKMLDNYNVVLKSE